MDRNATLALADATLSLISLALAIVGRRAIARRDIRTHRNAMIGAFASSAAFMILFVVRFVAFGFAPFDGTGPARVVYLVLLFTHEPIAVVSLPLVLAALVLGLSGRLAGHKDVVQLAFPIWLYSLASGVLLFVVLYLW